MRGTLLLAVLISAIGSTGSGQEADREKPTIARPQSGASSTGDRIAVPSPPPQDSSPRAVTAPGPGTSRAKDSAGVPALKGVQALEVRAGQARLALSSGPRTVRVGDTIGSDVVRSIDPARLLLARTLPDGSEATVVITFDEAGRGRVRVLYAADPRAALPAAVR